MDFVVTPSFVWAVGWMGPVCSRYHVRMLSVRVLAAGVVMAGEGCGIETCPCRGIAAEDSRCESHSSPPLCCLSSGRSGLFGLGG